MGTTKDVRDAVQAELTFDPLVDAIEITYDADPVDVTRLVQDALDPNALVEDHSDVTG